MRQVRRLLSDATGLSEEEVVLVLSAAGVLVGLRIAMRAVDALTEMDAF